MQVYAIPGNHDHYTDKAYKNKVFYQYFSPTFRASKNGSSSFSFNLKNDLVTHTKLSKNCHLIALDTTLSTPFYLSTGLFSETCEKNLRVILEKIPKDEVIFLTNHFPFFANDGKRRSLQRREALKQVIKEHPNINLYLHGHTHRHTLANLRAEKLPIISDSGSISSKTHGSFDLIEINPNSFSLETYFFDPSIKRENLTQSELKSSQMAPWKKTAKHCWEFL